MSYFTRVKHETTFNEEKKRIFLKKAHPDKDKTQTRLSKLEANKTRLSQNFSEARQVPKKGSHAKFQEGHNELVPGLASPDTCPL